MYFFDVKTLNKVQGISVDPLGTPFLFHFGEDAYSDKNERERLSVFATEVSETHPQATHFTLGQHLENEGIYFFPVQAYMMREKSRETGAPR